MARKNKHRKPTRLHPMAWGMWTLVVLCAAALVWTLHELPGEEEGAVPPPAATAAAAITEAPSMRPATRLPTEAPTPSAACTPAPTPTEAPTPTPPPSVTIAAVGDIMIHEKQLDEKHRGEDPYDFSCWFAHVAESIASADLALANLETTLVPPGSQYTGFPRFRSPVGIISSLKDAGFDVLTTANNHCFDGGWDGVVYTAQTIREMGLAQTGTYLSQEEFDDVLVTEAGGFRIGILAYSYAANGPHSYAIKGLDREQMRRDIAACRAKGAEIIVAMVHWGVEYSQTPSASAKDLTQYMWKEGVDLVLGSHPHVLQTMDRQRVERTDGEIRECAVIYSMGNFISNQKTWPRDVGLIYRATFTRNGAGKPQLEGIAYVPTWVNLVKETASSRHYEILPVGVALEDPSIVTQYNDTAKTRLRKAWDSTLELMDGETYGVPAKK